MKVSEVCKSYFIGFKDVSSLKKADNKTKALTVLKILSYFTVVIPLGFAAVYGAASLYGRIRKQHASSPHGNKVHIETKKFFKPEGTSPPPILKPLTQETNQSKVIQTVDSKVVRDYTDDLTDLQKSNLKTNWIGDNVLEVSFQENPAINVTIRLEDIFKSGAKVIINAANTDLGGGGGIDGAIHEEGGINYAKAHQQLGLIYKSNYVLGHVAMIESGLLKEKYNIDNVIVVAGPQGTTSPQKESELYSCYYNSLLLAQNQNKTSVAFPSISTGVFHFPKDRASSISLKAVYDFILEHPTTIIKTISIHFLPTEPITNLENYKTAASKNVLI